MPFISFVVCTRKCLIHKKTTLGRHARKNKSGLFLLMKTHRLRHVRRNGVLLFTALSTVNRIV